VQVIFKSTLSNYLLLRDGRSCKAVSAMWYRDGESGLAKLRSSQEIARGFGFDWVVSGQREL
jgi:hypothetical protein